MASIMIGGKNSPRLGDKSMAVAAMSSPMQGVFLMVEVALRVLTTVLTIAAMVATLVSQQSVIVFGLSFTARFTDASATKYKFIADTSACACSVLSLIAVLLLIRPNPNPNNYFVLFLHDGGVALLLGTGTAAGTTIGLLSRGGLDKVGWGEFCSNVPKFCHKITLSIGFSYVALAIYCVLAILSVYKLKACVAPVNYQQHHEAKEGI